jgi:hypothetical protein
MKQAFEVNTDVILDLVDELFLFYNRASLNSVLAPITVLRARGASIKV